LLEELGDLWLQYRMRLFDLKKVKDEIVDLEHFLWIKKALLESPMAIDKFCHFYLVCTNLKLFLAS
jgi:hypothetical protein